jgi:hypothetical protein
MINGASSRIDVADRRDQAHHVLRRWLHTQAILRVHRPLRQRIRREHRETSDPRETFVMGQVRRDGCADDQALDLSQKRFFSHDSYRRRGIRKDAVKSP